MHTTWVTYFESKFDGDLLPPKKKIKLKVAVTLAEIASGLPIFLR